MFRSGVAGHAITASGRNIRLQVRDGCMAEAAITIMCYSNRRIFGSARIMTARAGCPVVVLCATDSHICLSHMVNTAMGRRLIRMTIQTIGGIGTCGYYVYDILSRAVMTGGAGAGPVGSDIVFNSLNFRPVPYNMTGAAGRAVRKVIGAERDCCMGWGGAPDSVSGPVT